MSGREDGVSRDGGNRVTSRLSCRRMVFKEYVGMVNYADERDITVAAYVDDCGEVDRHGSNRRNGGVSGGTVGVVERWRGRFRLVIGVGTRRNDAVAE